MASNLKFYELFSSIATLNKINSNEVVFGDESYVYRVFQKDKKIYYERDKLFEELDERNNHEVLRWCSNFLKGEM